MLISCCKLKEYIKNSEDIDWQNIWQKFTIRTAEVENVKIVGNTFDNVVIAEIKECFKHPNSDHMHVLKVDCGEKNLIEVVCGAPNVRVGLKTAYVKVGGHIDGFTIKEKELRGILSKGMCCSLKELGLGENHEGIIELPSDAPVGKDIKKYLPIADIIVEIDNKSLTNRPDLWGHYGIAREIAAITGHELLPLDLVEVENNQQDLDLKISDTTLCPRYCGLKIANILNNVTPLDMQIFLNYVGMRSISLIVDLTNYIMLELGQPLHAFDAKIVKQVEVALANEGDIFVTLDGISRVLTKNTLMIKNNNEYFAIAGVMGGLSSEINENTQSIFLESANFKASSIRKTAVNLGLRTEASARFEKSLDPNLTSIAIKRYLYLLKKFNPDIKIISNLTDNYSNPLTAKEIVLSKELLTTYMGKSITDKKVTDILTSLGFKVSCKSNSYIINVPTFRATKDINIPEDIIEEIARLYGLENIEPRPLKLDLTIKDSADIFDQEYELKYMLATKYDLNEVHSYLWYDSNMLKELNLVKDGVKLIGKTENNILRDDLSLSLLNIVNENLKHHARLGIFEIATVIQNNENHRYLSVIKAAEEANIAGIYQDLKQIVRYIFKVFKNKEVILKKSSQSKNYYEENLSKDIIINDEVYGKLVVFKKGITNKIAKKKVIAALNIDFDKYCVLEKEMILAKEVSKYPIVELDYTIIMGQQNFAYLDKVINEFKSNLIKEWYLVGTYENKYTIRFEVGNNTRTLEQKDMQSFKERFIKHIRDKGLEIIE